MKTCHFRAHYFYFSLTIFRILHTQSIINSETLTPSNSNINGADITLNDEEVHTNRNNEWNVTVSAENTWQFILILDNTWGFHPNLQSTIKLTINISSITLYNLLFGFTVDNDKYFSILTPMDNTGKQNEIYPKCDKNNTPKQPFAVGNIATLPDTDRYCDISGGKCSHWRSMSATNDQSEDNQSVESLDDDLELIGFPITFTLQNDPIRNTFIISFETALSTASFIQKCGFVALPTDKGLKVYIAGADPGNTFKISSFSVEYIVPSTTKPSISPITEQITTQSLSPTPSKTSSAIASNVLTTNGPIETSNPTNVPTENPSAIPTIAPSMDSTTNPSKIPSLTPTSYPTDGPSKILTANPSEIPSMTPSKIPTANPSKIPSMDPTNNPTANPSKIQSMNSSFKPSRTPSSLPTIEITTNPSLNPTTVPSVIVTGTSHTSVASVVSTTVPYSSKSFSPNNMVPLQQLQTTTADNITPQAIALESLTFKDLVIPTICGIGMGLCALCCVILKAIRHFSVKNQFTQAVVTHEIPLSDEEAVAFDTNTVSSMETISLSIHSLGNGNQMQHHRVHTQSTLYSNLSNIVHRNDSTIDTDTINAINDTYNESEYKHSYQMALTEDISNSTEFSDTDDAVMEKPQTHEYSSDTLRSQFDANYEESEEKAHILSDKKNKTKHNGYQEIRYSELGQLHDAINHATTHSEFDKSETIITNEEIPSKNWRIVIDCVE